jgi:hypothetical protein
MAWWSWLVIWALLVLCAIGMLVWFGFRLFRKAIDVTEELGRLASKLEILNSMDEELRAPPFAPAVFADRYALEADRIRARQEKELRRQVRRDSLVRRGKLLVDADPNQVSRLIKRI